MSKFSGLVIGGPLAGRHLDHSSRHFNVIECKNLTLNDAINKASLENVTYLHTEVPVGGETFGLWLPAGMTPAQAFTTIAEVYSQYEDLK